VNIGSSVLEITIKFKEKDMDEKSMSHAPLFLVPPKQANQIHLQREVCHFLFLFFPIFMSIQKKLGKAPIIFHSYVYG
jgi:hypothetical protein